METSEKVLRLQRVINQNREPSGYVIWHPMLVKEIITFLGDLADEVKILENDHPSPSPPNYEGENIHILKF